jgi:hypothetical protein
MVYGGIDYLYAYYYNTYIMRYVYLSSLYRLYIMIENDITIM